MTLRARIAAAAGIAVAVVAVGLTAGNLLATRRALTDRIDASLREITAPHDRGPTGPGPAEPPRPPYGGPAGTLQTIAADGTVARPEGGEALPVAPADRTIAARGTGRRYVSAHVDGVHLRILTTGVGDAGAVQVARPLTEVDQSLDRLLVIAILTGAVGVAAALLLGALVARTALAPIRRFTDRTERIAADPDTSHRLAEVGGGELGRLAGSFNRTLDALEASAAAQRNLVADAGHELRTPIASLRTNIQVLQHQELLDEADRAALHADILDELDDLTQLVGDVVELARGAAPGAEVDDVALDQVVDALVRRFARRFPEVTFHARLEPTVVEGDPERITRAVSNLLDNARKWAPAGSAVELTLHDGTLLVRDRGPGIDPADLPHVFDRFYRSAAARALPGSGLGLAIVRQAAEAHGGHAVAANHPDGGALMRVRFTPAGP